MCAMPLPSLSAPLHPSSPLLETWVFTMQLQHSRRRGRFPVVVQRVEERR